jgi:hypothetical protein
VLRLPALSATIEYSLVDRSRKPRARAIQVGIRPLPKHGTRQASAERLPETQMFRMLGVSACGTSGAKAGFNLAADIGGPMLVPRRPPAGG